VQLQTERRDANAGLSDLERVTKEPPAVSNKTRKVRKEETSCKREAGALESDRQLV
jgi:hypothetical protein